jgi:ribose transport system permease protein
MKSAFAKFLSEHGMLAVLLLLGTFFSVVTYQEQPLGGTEAVTRAMEGLQKEDRVLLLGGVAAEDGAFGDEVEKKLREAGVVLVARVSGTPQDARKFLEAAKDVKAVICGAQAARWLVVEDVARDFPALKDARIVKPARVRFPTFLNASNLLNIANQIAIIAIVAVGMTMVIIAGGIDLSVGSLIALSAVLTATFIRDFGGGTEAGTGALLLCCLGAICVCGVLGGFSGLMVTTFDIPPFIVTLSLMLVGSGLAYSISNNLSISVMPDSFLWLGRAADLFGLPNTVVLMFVLYGLAHVLLGHMRLGRQIYAVGGNREAAIVSGLPVKKVVCMTYILSGLLAGLGGVIMTSLLKAGSPAYGNMYELYVIAAVVVGGTSLSGGKGHIFDTLLGAFTIAVMQNGMNLCNVGSNPQKIILGLVILGAVLLDRLRNR